MLCFRERTIAAVTGLHLRVAPSHPPFHLSLSGAHLSLPTPQSLCNVIIILRPAREAIVVSRRNLKPYPKLALTHIPRYLLACVRAVYEYITIVTRRLKQNVCGLRSTFGVHTLSVPVLSVKNQKNGPNRHLPVGSSVSVGLGLALSWGGSLSCRSPFLNSAGLGGGVFEDWGDSSPAANQTFQ